MDVLRRIAYGLLLAWAGSSLPAAAQDDFDPETPIEPYMRYKVKVELNESEAAYISGEGTYTVGTQVWVNTSAKSSNYTFSHWLKDGVEYSTSTGFYYTVNESAKFVAVYDFTPIAPSEPSGTYPRKLYLESSMEDACSFNRTSGTKVDEETYVNVAVYPNLGFEFKGWYENGTKVSESTSFNYFMGNADATLTAMFEYNPATPNDPNMADDQGSVDNSKLGDVNGNGSIDIGDAVSIVNYMVGKTLLNFVDNAADTNKNGQIDIGDAVTIVNLLVGKIGSFMPEDNDNLDEKKPE